MVDPKRSLDQQSPEHPSLTILLAHQRSRSALHSARRQQSWILHSCSLNPRITRLACRWPSSDRVVAEPGSLPRTVLPSRTLLQLRHDLLLDRDSDCPGIRCSATIRRDSFSTGQYSGSRFQILRVSPRDSLVLFPLLSRLPWPSYGCRPKLDHCYPG